MTRPDTRARAADAPVVGVSHKTVVQDIQATREVVPEVPGAEPRPITGLDGKTYQPMPGTSSSGFSDGGISRTFPQPRHRSSAMSALQCSQRSSSSSKMSGMR